VKILFLDIDGVLNSRQSLLAFDAKYDSPENEFADIKGFNPVSMKLLERICNQFDYSVYVHSSWARKVTASRFEAMFQYHECNVSTLAPAQYVGDRVSRITAGLDRYGPEEYVILDDADLSPFGANAIRVDASVGLDWYTYVKVCKLNGAEPPLILL